jgi:hypothetical protein
MKNKETEYIVNKLLTVFVDDFKNFTESEPLSKLDRFEFTIDLMYWAILPCFNINFHFPEFEFEWLCFGIYFRVGKL